MNGAGYYAAGLNELRPIAALKPELQTLLSELAAQENHATELATTTDALDSEHGAHTESKSPNSHRQQTGKPGALSRQLPPSLTSLTGYPPVANPANGATPPF
eukprot:1395746-Pleurochrysis_carterae.AAC.1